MQHEVRHASANQAVDLCADLCANSAKRAESEQNQENVPVLVTPTTATLRRPRTYSAELPKTPRYELLISRFRVRVPGGALPKGR